ncbi:MAG: hypothetical protein HYV09_38970 [Deltaproteobacteria bacterium]|nr:hypothetical protein [Deltaproteobacteria bacterium]
MAQVKGSGFTGIRSFLDERDPDARQRMRALLSADDAEILEEALAIGWYPIDTYVRVIAAIGPAIGLGSAEGARELGRSSADYDLSKIHRLFLRLANPAYVLEKAGEYWGRFYDVGEWRVTRESPQRAVGELRGFPVPDAAYCEFLVGYIGRMFELVGAKNVRFTHPRCRLHGAEACVFVGEWR